MTPEQRQAAVEEIFDLLLEQVRTGLEENAPIDETRVRHQLLLAEKKLLIAARRLALAEKKESGEKEPFSAKDYNEAIDRLMGGQGE